MIYFPRSPQKSIVLPKNQPFQIIHFLAENIHIF